MICPTCKGTTVLFSQLGTMDCYTCHGRGTVWSPRDTVMVLLCIVFVVAVVAYTLLAGCAPRQPKVTAAGERRVSENSSTRSRDGAEAIVETPAVPPAPRMTFSPLRSLLDAPDVRAELRGPDPGDVGTEDDLPPQDFSVGVSIRSTDRTSLVRLTMTPCWKPNNVLLLRDGQPVMPKRTVVVPCQQIDCWCDVGPEAQQWQVSVLADGGPEQPPYTVFAVALQSKPMVVNAGLWSLCLATSGPGGRCPPACGWCDVDGDGDVDLGDYAEAKR